MRNDKTKQSTTFIPAIFLHIWEIKAKKYTNNDVENSSITIYGSMNWTSCLFSR